MQQHDGIIDIQQKGKQPMHQGQISTTQNISQPIQARSPSYPRVRVQSPKRRSLSP